jgi:SAM-dependent methyltransferase
MSLFRKLKFLRLECKKGSSLIRALHNYHLTNSQGFTGRGIDYGAKNAEGSYYQYIDVTNATMSYTDLYSSNPSVVKSIDFEKDFDLSAEGYDFALCMNVLEHVFNHKEFIKNIHKSLRSGAVFEGMVPFLHYYHADPDDYFRYTHTGLEKVLSSAGFSQITVDKIACGSFTVSASMNSRLLRIWPAIYVWWVTAILLDRLVDIKAPNRQIYGGLVFTAYKL